MLEYSLQLSKDINKSLAGLTVKRDDEILFPWLFHSLVIEHHRSIIVLCDNQLYSSASSLIRCVFEAYIKGLWFAEFATESDFEKLKNDKFNKDFYKLVNALENKNKNGIKKAKESYWPNLNSLTHSGAAQLSRRINGTEIVSNFDDEFIQQMLRFSNNYALLSFSEVVEMSGDCDAQEACLIIIEKYKDTFSMT
ncbi:hypothetical protein PUND_b0455 [Pseudoalteromonas undina]|uniref:HEPN AbiU2-like domain-containing protein n=1 Tax=Pseudoalteromonas undina TaxID=43660 RepID=A0ABN0NJ52_9GAMM|nr:DUF5677 domain-containing protein [Pseudoalteromonas undina]KAF7763120.1 hypothetical protein PUND_b0455 [Pseudoalteromonas undina]